MMRRRRSQATPDVNVNGKLARLSSVDLESVSEQSLMTAGHYLDQYRRSASALDLETAMVNADQAHQAMLVLLHRLFPEE